MNEIIEPEADAPASMRNVTPVRREPRRFLAPTEELTDDHKPEARRGLMVMAAFAGVFLLGGSIAPLDSAVVGSGRVTVAGHRQAVQNRDGGIVTELDVREGQEVKAGAVLLRLDTTEVAAQERVLARQTIAARMLEARLLTQMRHGATFPRPEWMSSLSDVDMPVAEAAYQTQVVEFSARGSNMGTQVSVLRQRQAQSRAQIEGLKGQLESAQKRSDLTKDQLAAIQTLYDKGLAPLSRVRALQASMAELDGAIAGYNAELSRQAREIDEISAQSRQVFTSNGDQLSEQLREVQSDLFSLEPKLAAARAQIDRATVRAPVGGKVLNMTAFTEGGVVQAGQMLMEIVPAGAGLVVEAEVRPQDVEALKAGLTAQIRFQGAHARRSPTLFGKVTNVSADRLVDEKSGRSYFKLQATIDTQEIEKFEASSGVTVGPGAPADIIVPVRNRTALGYFLDPLSDALWKGMREQ